MRNKFLNNKKSYANYIVLISSVILFGILSILVVDGTTNNADNLILLLFRKAANKSIPVGPSWFSHIIKDLTSLGSEAVVIIISAIVVAFYLFKKKQFYAHLFLLTVVGGGVSDLILKEIFRRPRPNIVHHLVEVTTWSYPSGHAVMSIVVYFTLAYIATFSMNNRALKNYINISALIIIFIIGFSRIYLGVHNFTDILAGWALGIAWISIFKIIFNIINDSRNKNLSSL